MLAMNQRRTAIEHSSKSRSTASQQQQQQQRDEAMQAVINHYLAVLADSLGAAAAAAAAVQRSCLQLAECNPRTSTDVNVKQHFEMRLGPVIRRLAMIRRSVYSAFMPVDLIDTAVSHGIRMNTGA